jgi:ketosteroid isomerase-like protein
MKVFAFLLAACVAASNKDLSGQSSDSASVVGVVASFHTALRTGDSTTALRLLDRDAIILESGDAETRAEYRSHHLPEDIKFARTVRGKVSILRVSVRGSVAWVASTSVNEGAFGGRKISSAGAELMVLQRTDAGWKIAAIHWSSRARKLGPVGTK